MCYADAGRIAGWDHEWVQYTLTMKVDMFCRMGIDANLDMTKEMVCMPGFIYGKWRETVHKRRETGEGETFWRGRRHG